NARLSRRAGALDTPSRRVGECRGSGASGTTAAGGSAAAPATRRACAAAPSPARCRPQCSAAAAAVPRLCCRHSAELDRAPGHAGAVEPVHAGGARFAARIRRSGGAQHAGDHNSVGRDRRHAEHAQPLEDHRRPPASDDSALVSSGVAGDVPIMEERRSGTSALPAPGPADEVNLHGDLVPIPCGLDSAYWRNGLRPVYRILARLGGPRPAPDVIAGMALDLDSAMTLYGGSGFCDSDYRVGLTALGLDREELDRLLTLPPPERYDTLLERGWLGKYFAALENSVAERAIALRAEVRRLKPDLRFAFHASETPTDWFSLGLLRGFSSPDAPVLLWFREADNPRVLLRRFQARGIYALSALRLQLTRTSLAPLELAR